MNWIKTPLFKLSILFFILGLLSFKNQKSVSAKVLEKVEKAIPKTFGVSNYTTVGIPLSKEAIEKVSTDFSDNRLLKIQADSTLGYAYIGEANSLKNVFDFVLFLDHNFTVVKAKVLIYREDYGRQIGSQRWLKQFIGMRIGDSVKYGSDVDAISGATISAKSMTQSVADVLRDLKTVKPFITQ